MVMSTTSGCICGIVGMKICLKCLFEEPKYELCGYLWVIE